MLELRSGKVLGIEIKATATPAPARRWPETS